MSAEAENYPAALKQYKSLYNIHSGPHTCTIKLQQPTEQIRTIKKWSQNKMSNDGNKPVDQQSLCVELRLLSNNV